MPQLDFHDFAPQLVWLVLSFIVLYLLMAKLALPRVAAVLELRQHRLDDDLTRAANLKAEIDMVIAAYERALTEARTQAGATVKATQEKLAAIATERQRQASASLAEQAKLAEQRIAAAKASAIGNIRAVAIEAARAATAKLVDTEVDEAQVAPVVDRILKGRV
ncbi:MAG TPA: F0F1 ATP synthase subunit B' [Stellaceae bacterium]|nr:F0F1 ATP synthase subunit B' [Stellaceae bacterium]